MRGLQVVLNGNCFRRFVPKLRSRLSGLGVSVRRTVSCFLGCLECWVVVGRCFVGWTWND